MFEKLCLQWNDFKENAISAFGRLKAEADFADVILACEDGQQIEAHKVILASSSPFFEIILKKNRHPHPLIYMRGVNSDDLLAIIDFLYTALCCYPNVNGAIRNLSLKPPLPPFYCNSIISEKIFGLELMFSFTFFTYLLHRGASP